MKNLIISTIILFVGTGIAVAIALHNEKAKPHWCELPVEIAWCAIPK